MTPHVPLLVILAGPNGAGKSISAPFLLKDALAVQEFVNADTIAQGLSAYRPETAAVAAARIMLDRVQILARARADFAVETTLPEEPTCRGYGNWAKRDTGGTWCSSRCLPRIWRLPASLSACDVVVITCPIT